MSDFESTPHAAARLRPALVLLHPLWLAALVVLALNDHVLKGAGFVPGVIAGKLSDFAGLLVAPVLLAVVLRIRTRRWLIACHVAVAAVFGAIQLSAPLADAWSALMGTIGFPWTIVRDPTDLIALPMVVVSVVVFVPAMRGSWRSSARRGLGYAAGGAGLFFSVATSIGSDDGGGVEGERYVDIFADVYVHNDSEQDVVVRIREVLPSVDFDCDAIATDPEGLLDDALFGPATSWTMPPYTNIGVIDGSTTAPCYAARVEADNLPTAILFWRDGQPARRNVRGQGQDESGEGAIIMRFDDDGTGYYEPVRDDLLHLRDEISEGSGVGACAPQLDGDRLEWSEPVPRGEFILEATDSGVDGCRELELRNALDDSRTQRWYLCVPPQLFPFEAGDRIGIGTTIGGPMAVPGAMSTVNIVGLDAETGEVANPIREFVASRGAGLPAFHGLQAAVVPAFDCDYGSEPACGTAARAATLSVTAPFATAKDATVGVPVSLGDDGLSRIDLQVIHAQERVALNPECALGPDTLGTDLEVAALYTGPAL